MLKLRYHCLDVRPRRAGQAHLPARHLAESRGDPRSGEGERHSSHVQGSLFQDSGWQLPLHSLISRTQSIFKGLSIFSVWKRKVEFAEGTRDDVVSVGRDVHLHQVATVLREHGPCFEFKIYCNWPETVACFVQTKDLPEVKAIEGARVLLNLGDSVTTDHISPAGSIARNSPAAKYLAGKGSAHQRKK